MGFHAIVPAPPLDALVERIWDWDMPPSAHRLERILPTPNAGLIINLAEDQTRVYDDDAGRQCSLAPGSVFSGPYTRSFVIDSAEQQQVMGVIFRAGGALPFFREPIDRLSDRDTGLEDLAGSPARRLRQRLLEAPDPRRRLALLEGWLRARARDAQPHPLVAHALEVLQHAPQAVRIGSLVADCGISPRRFGELFRTHVGLGPKRHARLLRFRIVVDDVHRRRRVDWARVAADCGFHDQPHLVREFRAFAGMTPSAYQARQGPWANHVPLD
jgi:AraC-like DNA-binding protein